MTAPTASDRPPSWLDRDRYPFKSRWAELPEGCLHYVDEGEGRPLVMLHGNPTWSFLYRHLIRGLADDYRCIAPDLLGFGLSEKSRAFSYRPVDHARVVCRFLDSLDLNDAVLVCHDWGGPLGLDYATRRPEAVGAVVASNTWMWPRERRRDRALGRLFATRSAERLVVEHNAFARVAVAPAALRAGLRSAPTVYRHYAVPPDRFATWVLAREVVGSRAWLADLWDRRGALADTPVALLWGATDPIHGWMRRRWRAAFPDAVSVVYDAGHFVPEEVGPRLVPAIRRFLADA